MKTRIILFLATMAITVLFLEILSYGMFEYYYRPKLEWKKQFVSDVNLMADVHEADDKLFWRLRRDHPEINSLGFRGEEFPSDFTKKKIILFLGDSSVYGLFVHVEYTFIALLQKKLDGKFPGQYFVINAGVPGYSSYQSKLYFRELLAKFKPAIVMTYLGANDCWNEGNYISDSRKDDLYKTAVNASGKILGLSLFKNTNTFKMLNAFKIINLSHWKKLRVLPEQFAANLKEIEDTAKRHNAAFVAVNPVYTDSERIYFQPQDLLNSVLADEFSDTQESHIIKRFSSDDYVRKDGIYLVALSGYKLNDIFIDYWHPTRRGHEIIANNIFEELQLKFRDE